MLDMVRNGKVHCIIVKDFSRFGRNYIDVGDYLEQIFPFLGVRFISVTNDFDSEKQPYTAGSLDVTFKNLVNELYSKDISKKVKAAKYAKMKRGELMSGCPPYGYAISKQHRNRLIIDPVAAANIRRIFDMYVSGVGTAAIASLFNAEKIPTRAEYLNGIGYKCISKVANFWTQEAIAHILRDEVYIGTFIARRTKVAKVGSNKRISRPKEAQIILPDNHEAVVSKETFQLAQERLGERNCAPKKKRIHLFSGKVFCGHCQHALRRLEPKNQKNTYYTCNSSRVAVCGCSREKLLESELSETVLYAIKKYAEMALHADAILTDLKSLANNAEQKMLSEIYALQVLSDNLKQSKVQLYERYKADQLSKDMYLSEREQVEQEIAAISVQLESKKQQREQLLESGTENQFVQRFKNFVDAPCLTESMVQALVSSIKVFTPDDIQITWNFADDFERLGQTFESSNTHIFTQERTVL